MRVIKFVFLFAILYCLIETCLVLAQVGGNGNNEEKNDGCGSQPGVVRCKREVDQEVQQANSRIKRSLFSMLKKKGSLKIPPPSG